MRTKEENIALIKTLCDANGVSGFEDEVVQIGKKEIGDRYICQEDHLRNLYFHSKAQQPDRPLILVDAHSDEVGFIVQAIKPNGTMTFLPLGGWSGDTIPSSKVRIRNREGQYISGIVAARPPHFATAATNTPPQIANMVIDVGSTSRQETMERFKIGIGAPVVPDVTCTYDQEHDLFLGKALDCRIGVAAVLETLNRVQPQEVNVMGTLSVQEEVGERGMNLVAKTVHPDLAICFEGCPADDTFMEDWMIQTALKKGPMLRHYDRSMITHPRFQKYALDLARECHVPCQESVRSGGGTNGAMLHVANNGTPTIIIGIPVRYIHSHHGFAAYQDYAYAIDLAVAIIERMNAKTIAAF